MGLNDLHDIVGNQGRGGRGRRIDVTVQIPHGFAKRFLGLLVEIGNGNARGQYRIIRVGRREGRGRFCSQIVQLHRAYPVVQSVDDLFGHFHGLNMSGVQSIAQPFNAGRDFVEFDFFASSVSFEDLHGPGFGGVGG